MHPIILGVPRSGTSLCANLLTKMGFDFVGKDSMDPQLPTQFNPDGYFQRKSIHTFLSACMQRDFDNFNNFCTFTDDERKIFHTLLPKRGEWGIKEPYLQRYLPDLTSMTSHQFLFIVVYRNPQDTIHSIENMQKAVHNKTEYSEKIWRAYYTNVLCIMKKSHSKVIFLSYDNLVLHPELTYTKFCSDLQEYFQILKPLTRKELSNTIKPHNIINNDTCSETSKQLLHCLNSM